MTTSTSPSTRSVVVGYIPSPIGRAALAAAVAEARKRGARLVVVNAAGTDVLIDENHATEADLAQVESQISTAGIEFEIRQPTRSQSPADTLVEVAREVDALLVVIGLRRRSLVGKMIMGSTAVRVLLAAPCPVLTVKAAAAE